MNSRAPRVSPGGYGGITKSNLRIVLRMGFRDTALTTAEGSGLKNRRGDHKDPGITKFHHPFLGGSQNPLNGGGDTKFTF